MDMKEEIMNDAIDDAMEDEGDNDSIITPERSDSHVRNDNKTVPNKSNLRVCIYNVTSIFWISSENVFTLKVIPSKNFLQHAKTSKKIKYRNDVINHTSDY